MRDPRRRIVATVILCVACSLLLAGCSSGPPNLTNAAGASSPRAPKASPSSSGPSPTASQTANTACSLVTEQDVSTALGVDPGPGTEVVQTGGSACTFGASPKTVSVHLSLAGKVMYDQMRAAPVDGAAMVNLSGIGDAAFGVFKEPFASIGFYHGDAYVSIVIVADGSQDRAVALAKTADGRL